MSIKERWLEVNGYIGTHEGVPVLSAKAVALITDMDIYSRPVDGGAMQIAPDEITTGKRRLAAAEAATGSTDFYDNLYYLAKLGGVA